MRVLERYTTAVNSSNLAVDPRTTWSDTDVLGAAGYAAKREPLGIALTRMFSGGKVYPVVLILAELCWGRSRHLRIKISRVQAEDISKAVLSWHRDGTCQPCGGTGYQRIAGTPALSEHNCTHCQGAGRIPFDAQFPEAVRGLAGWLSGEVERSQAAAGSAAMALLAPRLDL